jgi:hypothetical protein
MHGGPCFIIHRANVETILITVQCLYVEISREQLQSSAPNIWGNGLQWCSVILGSLQSFPNSHPASLVVSSDV